MAVRHRARLPLTSLPEKLVLKSYTDCSPLQNESRFSLKLVTNAVLTKLSGKLFQTHNASKTTFPEGASQNDWVGPPDAESNMRLMKFHIPINETPVETKYRLMREDLQNWNQVYWAKHNKNFLQQKELFIKEITQRQTSREFKPDDVANAVNAQQMSTFYCKFLDENYQMHRDYNREWYKRNIGLLWPAARVYIQRLFKRKLNSAS